MTHRSSLTDAGLLSLALIVLMMWAVYPAMARPVTVGLSSDDGGDISGTLQTTSTSSRAGSLSISLDDGEELEIHGILEEGAPNAEYRLVVVLTDGSGHTVDLKAEALVRTNGRGRANIADEVNLPTNFNYGANVRLKVRVKNTASSSSSLTTRTLGLMNVRPDRPDREGRVTVPQTVRVVTPSGNPVEGVGFKVRHRGRDIASGLTRADKDGFVLHLPVGELRFRLCPNGRRPVDVNFDVPASPESHVVELAPQARGCHAWPARQANARRTGLSQGSGSITSPVKKWGNVLGRYAVQEPLLAHVDDDGKLELVVNTGEPNTYDGEAVTVYEAASGLEQWSREFPDAKYNHGFPAVGDVDNDGSAEVVVGTDDHKVYALDGATGDVKWTFETDYRIRSAPALGDVDADGDVEVAIPSKDDFLYVVDGTTGEEQWSFDMEAGKTADPAVGNLDEDESLEVVIGTRGNQVGDTVYALDGSTGKPEWIRPTFGGISESPTLDDLDGDGHSDVVFGTKVGLLIALDGTSGDTRWTWMESDPNHTHHRSSPAVGDVDGDGEKEVIHAVGYHATTDAADGVVALDAATGEREWKYKQEDVNDHSPAIGDIDGDGTMEVVFQLNGFLDTLDGRTGEREWRFVNYGDGLLNAPALGDVDGDGQLEVAASVSDEVFVVDQE